MYITYVPAFLKKSFDCRILGVGCLVQCNNCGKWIHGQCTKMKRITPSQARLFVCVKCELRLEEKVEPREELCNEVETVNGFCYLGDRVSANGGCEAAVTARARIG